MTAHEKLTPKQLRDVEVFLVAGEAKDFHVLEPLKAPLERRFDNVHVLDSASVLKLSPTDSILDRLAESPCPVLISSSLWTEEFHAFMAYIRAGAPSLTIGMEHGVAPFKDYTCRVEFVQNDLYIAPTVLWAERLKALYPNRAHKVWSAAYPRIDALRAQRKAFLKPTPEATREADALWRKAPAGQRRLVILSWGTSKETLACLPDATGVVYLLHPTGGAVQKSMALKKASVITSTPEKAARLLATADMVAGDFSSLTLEACALGVPTHLFIARELYTSRCDMDEVFFDRDSPSFARIPHVDFELPRDRILDLAGLARALTEPIGTEATINDALPAAMLPPRTNVKSAVDAICDMVANRYRDRSRRRLSVRRVEQVRYIASLYRGVLGRPPEMTHLLEHARALGDHMHSNPVKGLELALTFARSPEGLRRWSQQGFDWPAVKVPRRADAAPLVSTRTPTRKADGRIAMPAEGAPKTPKTRR